MRKRMEFPPLNSAHKGQDVQHGQIQPKVAPMGVHLHHDQAKQGTIDHDTWKNWINSNPPIAKKPKLTSLDLEVAKELFNSVAKSFSMTVDGNGRATFEVKFTEDGLINLINDLKGTEPDYEILQEQLVEVGDEFSDEFKLGISAAVAVLLEKKHLEEFLP